MARRTTLRASDADRDKVAEQLRHAAVEGRLQPEELDERLSHALSARTYGELDALVADLPSPVPARRPLDLAPHHRRPTTLALVAIVFVLMAAGAVISALAGHGHDAHGWSDGVPLFWLVWVVLGWRFFGRRRSHLR